MSAPAGRGHPAVTKAANGQLDGTDDASEGSKPATVIFGNLVLKPWYNSFYPDHAVGPATDRLMVCSHCFKYTTGVPDMTVHQARCPLRSKPPPGRLIYSHGTVSIYEVDGEEQKLYCQNLSLFAKLFLETKAVFFDVSIFLFYVLVDVGPVPGAVDATGDATIFADVPTPHHPRRPRRAAGQPAAAARLEMEQAKPASPSPVVGFFSKEKISWDGNNLACIVVFPPWQGLGFGQKLIAASYELSRRDGKVGGPEKPLSELGRRGYIAFWSAEIARFLLSQPDNVSLTVQDVCNHTFIAPADIVDCIAETGFAGGPTTEGDLVVSRTAVQAWLDRTGAPTEPAIDQQSFLVSYSARGIKFANRVFQSVLDDRSDDP